MGHHERGAIATAVIGAAPKQAGVTMRRTSAMPRRFYLAKVVIPSSANGFRDFPNPSGQYTEDSLGYTRWTAKSPGSSPTRPVVPDNGELLGRYARHLVDSWVVVALAHNSFGVIRHRGRGNRRTLVAYVLDHRQQHQQQEDRQDAA